MTKDLNASDTDMQATDTLFADPSFDAATSITNTNDSVEHASKEQAIMSHTAGSMKNMLGRSPGRRQKNHRDRLGNPETMEVRTLLTENPLGDAVLNFGNFGVGAHAELELTRSIYPTLADVRFEGDGGAEVLANGSITSLAQGSGRGDWVLRTPGLIDIKDVTMRVIGGSGGRIHVKTLTSDTWHDVGSGGIIPLNFKAMKEISVSTPSGLRLVLESMTASNVELVIVGPVSPTAVTEQKINDIDQAIAVLEKELAIPVGMPINWATKPSGLTQEVVGSLGTNGIPDAVTMSPDGKILLTSSRANDGPLVVRDMETGNAIKNLNYSASVKAAAISADGKYAAATYTDKHVVVWDIEKGSILQHFTTGDYSNLITFVPNTNLIAFESDAGCIVRTMDYVTGAITDLPVPSWANVSVSGTLASGDTVLAGSDGSKVTFYSLKSKSVVKSLSVGTFTRAISFSPDGKYAILGNGNNQITILDTSTWNTVQSFNASAAGVDGYLWDLKFLQGGTTLAVIGWNGKIAGVNVADLLTGKVTKTFSTSFGGEVTSATASADGSGMAIGIYQEQKVYAFSLFVSDGTRREKSVISAEIAVLEEQKNVLEGNLVVINNAVNSLFSSFDSLTQPWSPAEGSDLLHVTEDRGQKLIDATKNFSIIMSSLEDDDVALHNRMSTVGMQLSASIDEWMTTQEAILQPDSAIDTIDPLTLSAAPRLFATFRQTDASHSEITTHLRSPYDQTYIEFDNRTGQGHTLTSETISHPGGTMDTVWSKRLERQTNVPGGEFFVRMYSDATKTVLLDTIGGIYSPDSNYGTLDRQAGADTMGSKAILALSALGGTAALQSWQGLQNTAPHMQAESAGLSSHGSAFTLDLSGAEHLVTRVSFTVESENTAAPITARFYRGTELVGIESVTSGDLVDFSDAEGITSVLLANAMREMSQYARELMDYAQTADGKWQERRSAGGAAATYFSRNLHIPVEQRPLIVAEANAGYLPYDLSVSDLDISGNAYLPQVNAEPLTMANNADLSRAAHPYWGQSGDTLRRGPSPGYLAVGRFGPNVYGIRRDVNMFSVVTIKGLNGTAKINYVAYHTGDSDTRLSPEYYEIIGNTVVLKPGAPEQIVLYFGQENGNDPQGLNIDVEHRQSMTDDNLLPPAGMSIRTDILAIREPNASESVGPALSEIKDLGRPVTIGQGNVLMNVWNNGRTGGTVRVISNPETAGAREVSFALGAGEGKSVSMQFTVPASGNLKIRVVLPDGTIVEDGKPLITQGVSSEKRIVIIDDDGRQHLEWVPVSDPRPTVNYSKRGDPGFTAWRQEYMNRTGDTTVAEPANFDSAYVTYMETKQPEVMGEVRDGLGKFLNDLIDGIGGANIPLDNPNQAIWDSSSRDYWANAALHLYDLNKPVPGINAKEVQTLKLTAVGQLFLGIAQKSVQTLNAQELKDLARLVNAATGIDTSKVTFYLTSVIPSLRPLSLRQLFYPSDATQGDPTLRAAFETPPNCGTAMTASSANLLPNNVVRIRFNYATPSQGYARGNVYLLNEQGHQLSETPLVSGDFRNTLYIDLPLDRIASVLTETYGKPINAAKLKFKVALIENPGDSSGLQGMNITGSLSLNVHTAQQDLSTNTDAGLRQKENIILSQVAKNFPVDESKGWYNLLGSDRHHAPYDTHAADLNFGSAGADKDAPITAVADGKISKLYFTDNDAVNGVSILVITHTLPDQTTWDSVYMHMPMRKNADGGYDMLDSTGKVLVNLKEGQAITQKTTIGAVGTQGSTGEHLHFEAHVGGWRSGAAANLDGMFRSLKTPIPTKVSADGVKDYTVSFDPALQQWVNHTDNILAETATIEVKDAAGKVIDTYGKIQMRAWEKDTKVEDMKRVVWDPDKNAWFKWDVQANTWAKDSNHRFKWTLKDGTYQFLSE